MDVGTHSAEFKKCKTNIIGLKELLRVKTIFIYICSLRKQYGPGNIPDFSDNANVLLMQLLIWGYFKVWVL